MNCPHSRIKVTGRDEAFCYDCFGTVFTGAVPLDLQHPKNDVPRKYQVPGRGRGRRTSSSVMEMGAASRTVGK